MAKPDKRQNDLAKQAIKATKIKAETPFSSPVYDDELDASPQQMYYSRPIAPAELEIPEEIQKRHQESVIKFPYLNLSEGEYVIKVISRHSFGAVMIWLGVLVAIGAVVATMMLLSASATPGNPDNAFNLEPAVAASITTALIVIIIAFGYLLHWVYYSNKMFLTNESVIQNIQYNPFAKRQQTVSLGNIEDASYTKTGIMATMIGFGNVRLSTEGDETTYSFSYAKEPVESVAVLNNAVEAFKNGRPIKH